MLLGVLSDTHGTLPSTRGWPDFDLFVHAGDVGPSPTNTAADREVQHAWTPQFRSWIDSISAREKLVLPGNHDLLFEADRGESIADLAWFGAELQIESMALYSNAWTHHDPVIFPFPWAFGAAEEELRERFAAIPSSAAILVTHSPAAGTLDNTPGREVGSSALRDRLGELPGVRLHVHGHAHDSGGHWVRRGDRLVVNAARCLLAVEWDPVAGVAEEPRLLTRF